MPSTVRSAQAHAGWGAWALQLQQCTLGKRLHVHQLQLTTVVHQPFYCLQPQQCLLCGAPPPACTSRSICSSSASLCHSCCCSLLVLVRTHSSATPTAPLTRWPELPQSCRGAVTGPGRGSTAHIGTGGSQCRGHGRVCGKCPAGLTYSTEPTHSTSSRCCTCGSLHGSWHWSRRGCRRFWCPLGTAAPSLPAALLPSGTSASSCATTGAPRSIWHRRNPHSLSTTPAPPRHGSSCSWAHEISGSASRPAGSCTGWRTESCPCWCARDCVAQQVVLLRWLGHCVCFSLYHLGERLCLYFNR